MTSATKKCNKCDGKGNVAGLYGIIVKCDQCKGHGSIWVKSYFIPADGNICNGCHHIHEVESHEFPCSHCTNNTINA